MAARHSPVPLGAGVWYRVGTSVCSRVLDRYVIRSVIPPFLMALLVFTFMLILPFLMELAETLISKGVPGLDGRSP